MNTTTTLTLTPPTIVYSRDLKIARLKEMISEKRTICTVINHLKSHSNVYGLLERCDDETFKVMSKDNLSYSTFRFEDIEAVGNTCIWLHY